MDIIEVCKYFVILILASTGLIQSCIFPWISCKYDEMDVVKSRGWSK